MRVIGRVTVEGRFEQNNERTHYTLQHFQPGGRYSRGPTIFEAWVLQDNDRVLVVTKGEPPVLSFYPDLDTAKVALTLKGVMK